MFSPILLKAVPIARQPWYSSVHCNLSPPLPAKRSPIPGPCLFFRFICFSWKSFTTHLKSPLGLCHFPLPVIFKLHPDDSFCDFHVLHGSHAHVCINKLMCLFDRESLDFLQYLASAETPGLSSPAASYSNRERGGRRQQNPLTVPIYRATSQKFCLEVRAASTGLSGWGRNRRKKVPGKRVPQHSEAPLHPLLSLLSLEGVVEIKAPTGILKAWVQRLFPPRTTLHGLSSMIFISSFVNR